MELLDLHVYQELGNGANQRRAKWRQERDSRQHRLDKLPAVTKQQIEGQSQLATRRHRLLTRLNTRADKKKAALSNAKRAQELQDEIRKLEAQRARDAEIVGQATAIREEAKRFDSLSSGIPLLTKVWDARDRLSAEQEKRNHRVDSTRTLIGQRRKFVSGLSRARARELTAEKAHARREAAFSAADTTASKLEHDVSTLTHIEDLEAKLAAAEKSFEKFRPVLDVASQIAQDVARLDSLRTALPLVEAYHTRLIERARADRQLASVVGAFRRAQSRKASAGRRRERAKDSLEAATARVAKLTSAKQEVHQKVELLKDRLTNRASISGHDSCPICGSRLDSRAALSRLAKQKSHWEAELAALYHQEEELASKATSLDTQRNAANDKCLAAADAYGEADRLCVATQQTQTNLDANVKRAHTAEQQARSLAGDAANHINDLAPMRAEAKRLERAVPPREHALQVAGQARAEFTGITSTCQSQLSQLPRWSPNQRKALRVDVKSARTTLNRRRHAVALTAATLDNRVTERRKANDIIVDIDGKLDVAQASLGDLDQRSLVESQELKRIVAQLPRTWRRHPAVSDRGQLDALEAQRQQLGTAKNRESQLHAALERSARIVGAIGADRTKLAKIPMKDRRLVAEVKTELESLESLREKAAEAHSAARETLRSMEVTKEAYDQAVAERDEAELELGYYNRLARAFGPGGLQALIVREAHARIGDLANTTLARLTGGSWQLDFTANSETNELSVLAIDCDHPRHPAREFKFLSGGEKFRVAISVAVAIGQSVTGGRTIDSLIIDEGFGHLDEINRELLVGELGRLSQEVLDDGRIVIVSHQHDVIDEFANRLEVSRDQRGSARVRSTSRGG